MAVVLEQVSQASFSQNRARVVLHYDTETDFTDILDFVSPDFGVRITEAEFRPNAGILSLYFQDEIAAKQFVLQYYPDDPTAALYVAG